MKKTVSAKRPRKYPAHVYRHRWDGGHMLSGGCAIMATLLSVALLVRDFWPGLAAGIVASLCWLVFGFVYAEKKRMYVCVDREGVEIAGLFDAQHFTWPEIDDVWLTYLQGGRTEGLVIRPRSPDFGDLLITDRWDAPIPTIFEHIVRYRDRYGNESGAPVSGM
jgi:hypothetical protein